MAEPMLNPLAGYGLPFEEKMRIMENNILRNDAGQIISFKHTPIDEAVQAVREAQDSVGKDIWARDDWDEV